MSREIPDLLAMLQASIDRAKITLANSYNPVVEDDPEFAEIEAATTGFIPTAEERAREERRAAFEPATTMAEAFEQGVTAGMDKMSECCGCSAREESVPNPYRGEF